MQYCTEWLPVASLRAVRQGQSNPVEWHNSKEAFTPYPRLHVLHLQCLVMVYKHYTDLPIVLFEFAMEALVLSKVSPGVFGAVAEPLTPELALGFYVCIAPAEDMSNREYLVRLGGLEDGLEHLDGVEWRLDYEGPAVPVLVWY